MDKRKLLILSVVIITVLLSSFTFYFYQVIYSSNFLVEKENKYLTIPTGATFEDVQKIIYDERFVNAAAHLLCEYSKVSSDSQYLANSTAFLAASSVFGRYAIIFVSL